MSDKENKVAARTADWQALFDEILDHPKNRDRDAPERSALARRLKRLSYAELERILHQLS